MALGWKKAVGVLTLRGRKKTSKVKTDGGNPSRSEKRPQRFVGEVQTFWGFKKEI
jgi:hypothetical protein